MEATFFIGDRQLRCEVTSLDVAKLVAASKGYSDIDIEPGRPGQVSLKAYSKAGVLSFSGTSIYDACDKLIMSLIGDNK